MTSTSERLEIATQKAEAATDIAEAWANGPEYAQVDTTAGPLDTLAEFMRKRSSDILNGVRRVASVADLMLTPARYDGDAVMLSGYYAGSTDGCGLSVWVASSTAVADNVRWFAVTGVSVGRWELVSGQILSNLTLKIPSDFATLQAAIDNIHGRIFPAEGVIVDLIIESGHQPASGILVQNGDYGYFRVSAIDDEVLAASGFGQSNAFIRGINATMPTLNCLVDGNAGEMGFGYLADENSKGKVNPNCGAKNCWQDGLKASKLSDVLAIGSVFTGNAVNGNTSSNIHAFGGRIFADGANANDSNYYGVQASDGGTLTFGNATATNAVRYGCRGTNLGIVECRQSDFSGAGIHGIHAFSGAIVHAREAIANDCGTYGVTCSRGSKLYFEDGYATGCGLSGAHSSGGSTLNISGTNCRKTVGVDSDDDISINGSFVIKSSTTLGGSNITSNRYSSEGFLLIQSVPDTVNAALNANVNTWSLPDGATKVLVVPSNLRVVRGLPTAELGATIDIVNTSSTFAIRFLNEDLTIPELDRFSFPNAGQITLLPKQAMTLIRGSTRWQLLSSNGATPPIHYTVATLPTVTTTQAGITVWVTNESGGPCLAVNDGTNWRRVYDNAIVS